MNLVYHFNYDWLDTQSDHTNHTNVPYFEFMSACQKKSLSTRKLLHPVHIKMDNKKILLFE